MPVALHVDAPRPYEANPGIIAVSASRPLDRLEIRVNGRRFRVVDLARRTLTAFEPGHGLESLDAIVGVLAPTCGWDEARTAGEIEGYRQWLGHLAIPDPEGPRSSSFGADPTPVKGGR